MTFKTLRNFFLVFTIISFTYACKAIIEPDISNRKVTIHTPGSGAQLSNYNVGFWWDEMGDAFDYRLQVVSSRFDSAAVLVLDTVVKTSKFYVNLAPGNYQWRVRAENGSSHTAFAGPNNFTVLYGSLKQQHLQVISPSANLITNQGTVNFSWGTLYGATQYHLQIDTANFADEQHLFLDKSVPSQQFSVILNKDHIYQWRVRAENDTAQSQWTSVYTFTYDHTPPTAVNILQPQDKTTLASPVSLQWSAVTDGVKYKLYIYKADGSTLYSNNFPQTLTATSYSFSGTSGETVYWQVSAIDNAGNESTLSSIRSFTTQ